MKRISFIILIVITVSLFATTATAGPWTKNLGQAYLKVGESFYLAEGFVDSDGVFQEGTEYVGTTTSFYGEVGIWDRLQLGGYLPYSIATNTDDTGTQFKRGSLGDATIALQYAPFSGILGAFKLEAKIPLYDLGSYDGPSADMFPAQGDGQFDYTLWVTYGGGFAERFFAAVDVGYQLRTGTYVGDGPVDQFDYGDTLRITGQVGVTVVKPVFSISLQSEIPLEDDGRTKGAVTPGIGMYVPIAHGFAAEAGGSYAVWARNSSQGASFHFGLSYQL